MNERFQFEIKHISLPREPEPRIIRGAEWYAPIAKHIQYTLTLNVLVVQFSEEHVAFAAFLELLQQRGRGNIGL